MVQGLTEFLPVSSSAHLLIFRDFLQVQENRIILEIVLHLGTLLAVVVFLSGEIKRLLQIRILFYLALATALTGIIVILGQGFFESMFSAERLALPLLITGAVLLGTKRFTQGRRNFSNLKISDAAWLGIAQGLAVIPGLSRSGVTISSLLFRGVEKETAFKLSFLASIAAILGALIFKLKGFSGVTALEFKYMAVGFLAAFFSGLLALKILLAVIRKARLHFFGYYCLILAFLLWVF